MAWIRILALRQQLAVYKRKAKKPRLRNRDRLFLVVAIQDLERLSTGASPREARDGDQMEEEEVSGVLAEEIPGQDGQAKREHINRLMADIRSLEEDVKRLSALAPSDETPGDRVRSFIGDGDRQYLTGIKVGGRRILMLVDASASMLGETIVNIIRRRNLPDEVKIRADKWQQAVETVDWLTTQFPRESSFQVYTFNTRAGAIIPGSDGQWLDGGDREVLNDAVTRLKKVVPQDGTSLYHAFQAIGTLRPAPDNIFFIGGRSSYARPQAAESEHGVRQRACESVQRGRQGAAF